MNALATATVAELETALARPGLQSPEASQIRLELFNRSHVRKLSSELVVGDVIHEHGLRLQVDSVARRDDWNDATNPHGQVTSTRCSIVGFTSPASERDAADPRSSQAWVIRWAERDGWWNCQGNDLVRWTVEVAS